MGQNRKKNERKKNGWCSQLERAPILLLSHFKGYLSLQGQVVGLHLDDESGDCGFVKLLLSLG